MFSFEHSWAATSWNEPCLRKLLAIDGMRKIRCDQCLFGMTSVDGAGTVGLARKATRFMTNDEYIAEAVNRRCFGGHDHIQLLSGRAKSCEKCLPRLVASDTVCFGTEHASRDMRRSTRNDGTGSTADHRSSGSWADTGGASVAVAPVTTLTVIKSSETETLDCR